MTRYFKGFSAVLALLLVFTFTLSAGNLFVESVRLHTGTQVALNGGTNGCAITGATNASPIVFTCANADNFVTGDQVQITGIVGNTNGNTTGFVSVASPTTFSLYTTAALTTAINGNGAWTSGGYATEAADVSAITSPYLVRLGVEGLTANTNVVISIQDSIDGFVSNIVTLAVFNLTGTITQGAPVEHTFRDSTVPSSLAGSGNARFRVLIQSITNATTGAACTTTCSVTTSLIVQN